MENSSKSLVLQLSSPQSNPIISYYIDTYRLFQNIKILIGQFVYVRWIKRISVFTFRDLYHMIPLVTDIQEDYQQFDTEMKIYHKNLDKEEIVQQFNQLIEMIDQEFQQYNEIMIDYIQDPIKFIESYNISLEIIQGDIMSWRKTFSFQMNLFQEYQISFEKESSQLQQFMQFDLFFSDSIQQLFYVPTIAYKMLDLGIDIDSFFGSLLYQQLKPSFSNHFSYSYLPNCKLFSSEQFKNIEEGIYYVNVSFSQQLFKMFAEKLCQILENNKFSVIFVFQIPWEDCEAFQMVKASKFFIKEIYFSRGYIGYNVGKIQQQFITRSTYLLIFGSQAGKDQFQIMEKQFDKLKQQIDEEMQFYFSK